MARFSLGGIEDENGEGSNNGRSSKKLRITDPYPYTGEGSYAAAAAVAAAVSTLISGDRAKATSSAHPPPPENRVAEEDESEVEREEESDPPPSDYQLASEEEPDADVLVTSAEHGAFWSVFAGESEVAVEEEADSPLSDFQVASEADSDADDDEVQLTDEAIVNGSGTIPDSEGDNGSNIITLTDKDALDCPICFDPLRAPVYQCENGHIACGSCCNAMDKKCASCQWPIGSIRNRAIERVIESVRVKCKNMLHGCTEILDYSNKQGHERTCIYAPCSCPDIGCNYVGMSTCLYEHFASQHSQSSQQLRFDTPEVIRLPGFGHICLQEEKDKELFVLYRSQINVGSLVTGSLVSLICIEPTTTKRGFLYSLTATYEEESNNESSIELVSHTVSMAKWRPGDDPAEVSLLVPNKFVRPGGELVVKVLIWRRLPVAT